MPHAIPLTCDNIRTCTVTRALVENDALRVYRAFYCEAGGTRCERARRMSHGERVGPELLPDGRNVAVVLRGGRTE